MIDDIVAAQHFEGELYIKASDHHRIVRVKAAAEREATAKRCAEIADEAEPYQAADLIRKAFGVDK
jgi:hypothetical protein